MLEKLIELLTARGYSQRSFEVRMRLSPNKISKWKNGEGEPSCRMLWQMAVELGVSTDYLLDDSQDRPGATLPPQARTILEMAERLGWDVAMDRLLAKPSVPNRVGGGLEVPFEPVGRGKEERGRQHKAPKKDRLPKP